MLYPKNEPIWGSSEICSTSVITHAIKFYRDLDQATLTNICKTELGVSDANTADQFSTLAITRRLKKNGFLLPRSSQAYADGLEAKLKLLQLPNEIQIETKEEKEEPVVTDTISVDADVEFDRIMSEIAANDAATTPQPEAIELPAPIKRRRGRPPGSGKTKPMAAVVPKLKKDGTPRKQRSDKGQKRGPRTSK